LSDGFSPAAWSAPGGHGIRKTGTVWSGDLDVRDEGFDEGLALVLGAGADDRVDVLGDLEERGCLRFRRLMGQGRSGAEDFRYWGYLAFVFFAGSCALYAD
jgi:hypothetical protein